MNLLCEITPCSLSDGYRRFSVDCVFVTLLHQRLGQQVSPKRLYLFTKLFGVILHHYINSYKFYYNTCYIQCNCCPRVRHLNWRCVGQYVESCSHGNSYVFTLTRPCFVTRAVKPSVAAHKVLYK